MTTDASPARHSWSAGEDVEKALALPTPPPKPRRLALGRRALDADNQLVDAYRRRLSALSDDSEDADAAGTPGRFSYSDDGQEYQEEEEEEREEEDGRDAFEDEEDAASARSTPTVSSADELDKRSGRESPNILFGRDVIQVPLQAGDEYVNLVLSHREFEAMAVHIPQYDQVPPLELVDDITRLVRDAESRRRLKPGLSPDAQDAAAVFQTRVLELEYEIKRLGTKLAAARALQTSLTDENTTLRVNVRELEASELDYEKLYLQNELLREQALHAVAEVARVKRLAAAAQGQVQTFKRELDALKQQVVADQDAMLQTSHDAFSAMVGSIYQREQILQDSYLVEKAERQLITEKYYELSGRIRVFCRLRPPTSEDTSALLRPRHNSVLVEKSGKEFVFDQVFGPESAQRDVYHQMEPLVVSFADGYNACILAYGQTGSGKTFTMMGNSDDPGSDAAGMIPRALQQVFSIVEARKLTYQDSVTVSMVEIYNDQILDLLGDESNSDSSSSSAGRHQPVVKSDSEIVARSVTVWSQVRAALAEGNANRNIASTNMNVESSRSHAMVFLHLESQHRDTMEVRKSTLCLVDLAGSERISRSKVEGDRLKETQHINKSLSALGDVVYALQHKAKHVPFRNSKLTFMLRDMLSGQAKTLMMLQLSPDNADVEETKCSLNFGARVSQVQMGAVRQSVESGEIFKLKDENQSLAKKVSTLERKLSETKQQCEQKASELKTTLKTKRSLERQLWLLGGSEHDAPPRPSLTSSPHSTGSNSPPESSDIPLHPPSPAGSVKSTRSTMSTASSATTRSNNRGSGSTRRSLASSFSRLIGGRGSSSPSPKSKAAESAPAPSPPGSLDRESRRKSLNAIRSERSTLVDREARRQSLDTRTSGSIGADAEARRRSMNPRGETMLEREARRKSLNSLPSRPATQSSAAASARKVPDAPTSLPSRRPLFPTASSSSSIPTAPGSGSRIPKTRGMASSFTSASSTPTRSAPLRRAMSSTSSAPSSSSGAPSASSSARSSATSGIASRGEPRRSTLGSAARSTTTSASARAASTSSSVQSNRRTSTGSSWK